VNVRRKKMNKIMMIFMILILSISVYADTKIELLNQEPDPATAGSLVELKLSVENTGKESIVDQKDDRLHKTVSRDIFS